MDTLNADICVIGAGSAGLSVAAGAAQLGRKVVLIEQGQMGGDCLNTGCVPSKALIAAANRAHAMRNAGPFGLSAVEPNIDAMGVHAHVHEAMAAIAPNDSQERFAGLGVRVIRAAARFIDPKTIEADGARISARRFVVATGSRPSVPPIPGLDRVEHFTNESIFEKKAIPAHLIVIGGGPVGVELAQAHRRLGSMVTVVEAERMLPREDAEMAAVLRKSLTEDGVRKLMEATHATSVAKSEAGLRLQLVSSVEREAVEGSHLLVAAGRKPNVENLGLDKAGIAFDNSGIKIDHRLKTTNARTYAIGDVTGAPQFTHVANYHAGLVIRHALFRLPVKLDHASVPRVTYCDPELAHVGMTEEEARKLRSGIAVARAEFAHNDRAVTDRQRTGSIKIVVGRAGRVLGATIAGAHAGELILPWVMALRRRASLRTMTDLVVPYPTLSEISKRAASNHYAPALFSRGTRRLVEILSWF